MKNILITGAAQGIGRAIAELFIHERLHVIDKQETDFINNNKDRDNFSFFLQDLADRKGTEKVLEELKEIQFDAIINNAGEVYLEKWADMNLETWDRTLAVNATAPLHIVKSLSESLRNGASIVNIASVDGRLAAFDTIAYAASKAVLINLTQSLAAVLGDREIRVNAVAPGWVETEMTKGTLPAESREMTPLGRNALAQDIAEVVEFLVSDKSKFISGETITVDGGLTVVDYTLKLESEENDA